MRNALALLMFHIPRRERRAFLTLLFPDVPWWRRREHLRTLRDIPAFGAPAVQRALRTLRPTTYRTADVILNAADVAIRIIPSKRDAFIHAVACPVVTAVVDIFRMRTLYDWMEPVLRNISNEDRSVVRAIARLDVDPYSEPFLNEPGRNRNESEYSNRLNAEERAVARVFRPPFARLSSHEVAVIREMGTSKPRGVAEVAVVARATNSAPPRVSDAVEAVARSRFEHEIGVLRAHAATLRRQLDAQNAVMRALEIQHETDQQRIQELERAQERTRRAFDDLRHAEDRRFDAYFGVRRPQPRNT